MRGGGSGGGGGGGGGSVDRAGAKLGLLPLFIRLKRGFDGDNDVPPPRLIDLDEGIAEWCPRLRPGERQRKFVLSAVRKDPRTCDLMAGSDLFHPRRAPP